MAILWKMVGLGQACVALMACLWSPERAAGPAWLCAAYLALIISKMEEQK